MKIFAWIIVPFFMLLRELEKDDEGGLVFLLIVPVAIIQIFYWFVIFNFPVILRRW